MFETIRKILLNYVDVPEDSITLETTFLADLGMTSLDIMTMIGDIEDEYNIEIPTEDLSDIYKVKDLIVYLESKVGERK